MQSDFGERTIEPEQSVLKDDLVFSQVDQQICCLSKLYPNLTRYMTIHSTSVIKLKWGWGGKGLMVAVRGVGASLFINWQNSPTFISIH